MPQFPWPLVKQFWSRFHIFCSENPQWTEFYLTTMVIGSLTCSLLALLITLSLFHPLPHCASRNQLPNKWLPRASVLENAQRQRIEFEFIDYLYLNFSPSSLHQSELFTFFKTQFKLPSPSKSFLWSYHPKVASLLCYFPLEMLLVEQFEIHFPHSYIIMGSGLLSCPRNFALHTPRPQSKHILSLSLSGFISLRTCMCVCFLFLWSNESGDLGLNVEKEAI